MERIRKWERMEVSRRGTDKESKSQRRRRRRKKTKAQNTSNTPLQTLNPNANTMKKAMPSETPDSAATTGNEKPKKKRQRSRKRKRNQVDNSSASEERKEEAEVPCKKFMKETLTAPQRKYIEWNQRKIEVKEQVTHNTSASSCDAQQTAETSQPPQTLMHNKQSILQTPILHPSCTIDANKMELMSCWSTVTKEGIVLLEDEIEVMKRPFTCCYLANLLENKDFLEGVKRELEDVQRFNKNNDLYKKRLPESLKDVTTPYISSLRRLLYTEVRQWLMEVTKIPLSDTVDMGLSRYTHTDVLRYYGEGGRYMEGRRILYILYLLPPWQKEDGGSLNLFCSDDDEKIERSLIPKNNAFAFFEVSPTSFHQFSEVCRDKTLLSINGWFHGPPFPRPRRKQSFVPPRTLPGFFEEENMDAWINPMYLDMEMQKKIRQKFSSESKLELDNFLTKEAYEKVSHAFRRKDLAWESITMADMQQYEVLVPDNMPQEVKKFQQFLECEAFFLVLSQLTGLKLHSMAPQDYEEEGEPGSEDKEPGTVVRNPLCRMEVQRWRRGCYTLTRDGCVDHRAALDAYLYTNTSEKWRHRMGDYVTYSTQEEDEEMLTNIPRSMCLNRLYQDAQTDRFNKYINAFPLVWSLIVHTTIISLP